MYYIVNKETKEHRVRHGVPPKGWYKVKADDHGWIKWDGGECPVSSGSKVDIEHRDNDLFFGVAAINSTCAEIWDHDGHIGDIIAYRPACYHEQGEVPEWDGEGLPPVGAECEARMSFDGWVKVRVLHHNQLGNEAVVVSEGDGQAGWADEFRPIRTPDQRAEDRAVEAMVKVYKESPRCTYDGSMRDVYAEIREGRIPGVKLEEQS